MLSWPGIVLGSTTGLLVGLATSPVSGVAVTGLVTITASILSVGADNEEILSARWKYFGNYAICFCAAFALFAAIGYGVRAVQPTPADKLELKLEKLGVQKAEIAKYLAEAAGNVSAPDSFFGTGIFYGNTTRESRNVDRDPPEELAEICAKLGRPPWPETTLAELKTSDREQLSIAHSLVEFLRDKNVIDGDLSQVESKLGRIICAQGS
ncbi:hypothetical protein AB9F47_29310 [Rhizobium leguminosarum]|uniref:hypothetical protein n=1 Tax=Rhizobium leguminosarum TaxID=384 RepID=UPI003F980F19